MAKDKFTDKEILNLCYGIVFTFFIIFLIFLVIRLPFISLDIDKSDLCNFEFGENWVYEYDVNFGRTCVELDYVTFEKLNRTKFPYTPLEISEKFCDMPRFFDLTKWSNGCLIQ